MNLERTLITGASSGIGLHLAREFARHGHPLVLVAPAQAELEQVATELRDNHNVEVRVFAKDLGQPEAPQCIFDTLAEDGMAVDILVNDAAVGQSGRFWETPLARDLSLLRVNLEAVVRFTKLFLPPMLQRQQGRILNLASMPGVQAGAEPALGHATSAFIRALSESLARELEGTGVTVTALCAADQQLMPEVAAAGYKAMMEAKRVVFLA